MPEKEQLIQTFVESLDMCLICEQAKLYKQNVVLKGTVSRDFRHIFYKKNSTWSTYKKTGKNSFAKLVRFSEFFLVS